MTITTETEIDRRSAPWALLSKPATGLMTAAEAIEAGGLDWNVEPRSLFVSLPGDKRVKIKDRRAIVRDSDDAVLGIVSDKYVTFQNRDAFGFADNLVQSGAAQFDSTFSVRHGKVVGLVMKLPEQIMVGGEDAHDMYTVLRTSHDGSKAVQVAITPIRLACTNQVAFAIKNAKHKWSMQHTSTLEGKLQEARETLQLSWSYAEEFQKAAEDLMRIQVTNDKFHEIIADLLPVRPKTDEVIESIESFYRESPTNGYNGTAWGALNAVTEYFEHGRETRSAEAVFTGVMDGNIATLRNNLTARLFALA